MKSHFNLLDFFAYIIKSNSITSIFSTQNDDAPKFLQHFELAISTQQKDPSLKKSKTSHMQEVALSRKASRPVKSSRTSDTIKHFNGESSMNIRDSIEPRRPIGNGSRTIRKGSVWRAFRPFVDHVTSVGPIGLPKVGERPRSGVETANACSRESLVRNRWKAIANVEVVCSWEWFLFRVDWWGFFVWLIFGSWEKNFLFDCDLFLFGFELSENQVNMECSWMFELWFERTYRKGFVLRWKFYRLHVMVILLRYSINI